MPPAMLAAGTDRNALAIEFQGVETLTGAPPGTIVRPHPPILIWSVWFVVRLRVSRKLLIACVTAYGYSRVAMCPARGMRLSLAPGMALAMRSALAGGVTMSSSPTMTSVGVVMRASS